MKQWLPWIFGSAILIGVVIVGIHFSETQDLVRVVQTSRPLWILAATFLQLMTYLAQGEVF